MAVKKTAAEQNAENTVSAEPAQSKPGVSIYVGPSILGYIQKNTIYPCAAAEAVERDDVKIATEKYPGVADFIINGALLMQVLAVHRAAAGLQKKSPTRTLWAFLHPTFRRRWTRCWAIHCRSSLSLRLRAAP